MTLALRPPAVGGALVLSMTLLACLLAAGQAMAGEHRGALVYFDIAPQSLASALTLFGEASGYSVLVAGELTTGRHSEGVQGEHEPRQALQLLLAGTGLVARFTAAGAFTLEPGLSLRQGAAPQQHDDVSAVAVNEFFAAALQAAITRALCLAQPRTFGRYRLGVQLWIGPHGHVERISLLEPSGERRRDLQVEAALRTLDIGAPLPAGLPQPVTVLLMPRPDPEADCRLFSSARSRHD